MFFRISAFVTHVLSQFGLRKAKGDSADSHGTADDMRS
jgi:hypothetical protein